MLASISTSRAGALPELYTVTSNWIVLSSSTRSVRSEFTVEQGGRSRDHAEGETGLRAARRGGRGSAWLAAVGWPRAGGASGAARVVRGSAAGRAALAVEWLGWDRAPEGKRRPPNSTRRAAREEILIGLRGRSAGASGGIEAGSRWARCGRRPSIANGARDHWAGGPGAARGREPPGPKGRPPRPGRGPGEPVVGRGVVAAGCGPRSAGRRAGDRPVDREIAQLARPDDFA